MNLSEREIEDELVTWVMGGHETTASLLTWTFHLLDQNPLCYAKVMQEIQQILANRTANNSNSNRSNASQVVVPTYEELQQMVYTHAVLKETLRYGIPSFIVLSPFPFINFADCPLHLAFIRLYPPAPILNRVTTKDIKLGSHAIPKNVSISYIYSSLYLSRY